MSTCGLGATLGRGFRGFGGRFCGISGIWFHFFFYRTTARYRTPGSFNRLFEHIQRVDEGAIGFNETSIEVRFSHHVDPYSMGANAQQGRD